MKKKSVTQELDLFAEEDFLDTGNPEQTVVEETKAAIPDEETAEPDESDDSDSIVDIVTEKDATPVEYTDIKQLRSSKKKLRVTFPDSSTICYNSATATFIETLKRIGVDRLQDVNLCIKDVPLFSKEINPRYKDFTKPLDNGWYAIIQSDTDQKFLQLSSVKTQLGLDIKIEVGVDFETEKADETGKKVSKSRMTVKFPDGIIIAGTNPVDTFVLTLKRIGISKLYQKKLQFGNKQLITTSKNYPTQVSCTGGYWINVPGTSKEKYKQLKVIAAHMHISLDVKII